MGRSALLIIPILEMQKLKDREVRYSWRITTPRHGGRTDICITVTLTFKRNAWLGKEITKGDRAAREMREAG